MTKIDWSLPYEQVLPQVLASIDEAKKAILNDIDNIRKLSKEVSSDPLDDILSIKSPKM